MDKFDPLTRALQYGVDEQVFPGAVLLVRCKGHIRYHEAVGFASHVPSQRPARLETIYDLASLTKPLATSTGILCLVQDGLLALDQPIESVLQELRGQRIGQATVRDLLAHRSGLPAYRPYYEKIVLVNGELSRETGSDVRRHEILELIAREPFDYQPRTTSVYSDLGYILLGFAIETRTQQLLSQYCEQRIFYPLKANPLMFFEGGQTSRQETCSADIAPTEQDAWRGRLLEGEVHDENAYVLGGVAGHAGLFGTARAVAAITKVWLDAYHGRDSVLDSRLVRQFVSRQEAPDGSSWALGWDTPSPPSSSGKYFSGSSFGHLGFTGTSIWIDPAVDLEVILLSNRVHPTRDNNKIRDFRPMIHDVICEEVVK